MGLIFKYYVFIGLGRRTKADIWVIKLQTPGREQLEGRETWVFSMQMSQGLWLYLECSWTGACAPEPSKAQGSLTSSFSLWQKIELCLTTLCSGLPFPSQFVSFFWLSSLFSPFSSLQPFWFGWGRITGSILHPSPTGRNKTWKLLKCWILLKSLSTQTLVWIKPQV